jgi:phosphoglycolate phosphatase-like HAD superfamily hydrolase
MPRSLTRGGINMSPKQNEKSNKKVIGFDFDGTIIDIEEQKSKAFGVILNQYWGVDIEEAAQYWIDTGGKSRRSKFDYFFNKRYGGNLTDEGYKDIESEFSDRLKNEFYPKVKFIKGALKLLEFCRKNFDIIFVSSGVPDSEIKYLIRLKGAEKYFDRIYGTSERFKGKEDHFREIIKEFSPRLLIFAGDGFEDMRVGRKYGAVTIGVPSHQTGENLIEAGARYVLPTDKISRALKNI